MAPEILARKGYDGAIMDVWSCDIVLFVLNAGYLPFNDYNVTILYRKIKNLVTRLLDTNPETRIVMNKNYYMLC